MSSKREAADKLVNKTIKIDATVWENFETLAHSAGKNASELLRELLAQAVQKNAARIREQKAKQVEAIKL